MIQIEGFNIRIVVKGETYGLDDNWINEGDDAIVEFYDAKAEPAEFGKRGQFVSRYYIFTVLNAGGKYGLQLDGGSPEWSISPAGMREVHRYLKGFLQEAA